MKNRQIYILCFILTFLLLSTLIYGQELGDVNSDNNIDIVDALLTAQYYVGLNPSGFNPDVADTNGDGMADIVDALLIAQYYVGLITEFPGAGTPVPTETPEITPTATPGETPSGIEGMGLVLQYMCQEPQPDVKTIKPRFNIINGGTDTINLGGIKIRYWYTKESWAEEVLDVPYARIGQEYVSGVFYYNCLEVSIADQAGTLAPSGETGNINLAFHNVDWDVYNQSDDYSFDPSFTDFADWEKVTLLYYSYQVWGTDPYGNGPGSIPGPVPTEPPLPTPMANKPFEEDYSQKAAASVITGGSAPGIASGSSVTIDVDTNAVKRRIPQTIMGNNVGVWIGKTWFEDQGFKDRIAAINTSLLRFPGGSRGDRYHWDENYPQYLHNQGWVPEPGYAVDTASLMRVCYETGARPVMIVNHGFHEYNTTESDGTLQNAIDLAVNWVEYCNSPNNGSNPNGGTDWAAERAADGFPDPFHVKYWEIGNEVYGSWEIGYEEDGAEYGRHFNAFYDAMKAVDPDIYIGLAGYVGDGNAFSWTQAVLSNPGTADRVDFIDIHDYFFYAANNDLPEEEMLDLADQIRQNRMDLDRLIEQNTGRPVGDITYYFGEYNMTNPTNYHSTQLVSGLFIAKALGEMIDSGYSAASFWVSANNWKEEEQGDHGFMARNHPTVPDYTPYAAYYPFFFYTRNFGDTLVGATSSDPDVHIYASTFSSGDVGLVIINESASNRTAAINLDGFTTSGQVNSWILSGQSLAATAVSLNGRTNGYSHGGPGVDEVTPYYWSVGSTSSIQVNLEKNSVTSLVIY